MAAFTLTNPYVYINGASDISSYVRAVTLDVQVETPDTTTASSTAWKSAAAGLKSATIQLELNQDVAASALDSIVWPLLGTTVAFQVNAASSTTSTSNPKWTGNMIVNGWQPVKGSVGDVATISVTFPVTGAVTRATS